MIRRALIISFLMFFVISGVILAGTKAGATPKNSAPKSKPDQQLTSKYKGKMELSDDVFDFGFLPKQSKVSHTFWLHNIGLDTLEIITIKPG